MKKYNTKHTKRLEKTHAKLKAVCTQMELAEFIEFVRRDTMRQLNEKTHVEREKLFNTFSVAVDHNKHVLN